MSNTSFGRSIGGKQGSGSINASSINLGQRKGSPCDGYSKPSEKIGGSAAGRIAPEAGVGNATKRPSGNMPR